MRNIKQLNVEKKTYDSQESELEKERQALEVLTECQKRVILMAYSTESRSSWLPVVPAISHAPNNADDADELSGQMKG
jgi:hypothetical protein